MTAVRASRRLPMRLIRPLRVRPPWRSSESCPLQVWKVDSIHWRMRLRLPKRGGSSLRSGRMRVPPSAITSGFELGAGEAFIGDHGLSGLEHAFEQFGGDDPFGGVGGGELESDREPVGGAEEVEPEAPEPAAVGAAVAVAAKAGEVGAKGGLA